MHSVESLKRLLYVGVILPILALPLDARAGGGIRVSPVVVDTSIKKSGDSLPPITVSNESDEVMDVSIDFKPLGHNVDGNPIPAAESYKFAAHKFFNVKNSSFKLKPGDSQIIELKVNMPAGYVGGGYAIMYVLGKPASAATAKNIATYVQIGVIIELGLPGNAKRAFTAGAIDARQDAPNGPITLLARANNTGDTHISVGGSVVISDDKGKEIGKTSLEAANIFPLLSRNIKASFKPPAGLPAGKYKVAVSLTSAGLPAQNTTGAFEVARPGELAQTKATVTKFPVKPAVQNKPIELEASVLNQGNVAFSPVGLVSFLNTKNEVVGTAKLAATAPIPPGQKGLLKGVADKGLPLGTYQARLEILNPAENILANFGVTLQVIEKEVVLAAKITKLAGPSPKEPYVNVELKNDSNVDVDTDGVVLIADGSGNIVGQVPLEKQHVTQGGTTRYQRPFPDGMDPGLYELRATLNYGGAQPATSTNKYYKQ